MRKKSYFSKKVILLFAILIGVPFLSFGQVELTIEDALNIATEKSPELLRSKMSMERSQLNLAARRAGLKSRFSLNLNPVSYSKNRSFDNRISEWYTNEQFQSNATFQVDQPLIWTDGTLSLINTVGWQDNYSDQRGTITTNNAFSNSLYLRLNQPIFTYNRTKMEIAQLEHDLENSYISYALQRLRTESQITSLFYNVYMAQQSLEIRKEELDNAQQSYNIIKNKVDADLAAKDEFFQAELNLLTAQSAVDEGIVNLADRKDQLKQTIGMSLDDDFEIKVEIAEVKNVLIDQQKATSYGLSSRLELRQREIESENLEFSLIQTKAQNEFRGDIALSVGIMGDHNRFSNIYDNPTSNPRVSISFSVPIFDWGANKARVKAQQVAQNIAQVQYDSDKANIDLNIRQTCRSLNNLRTKIDIENQNVKNAQLTYDLNVLRYRQGDLTGMEMSQFQTQLSNRKISYIQSLINYKVELLNLKILSLYDFEKNEAIVPLKDLITE